MSKSRKKPTEQTNQEASLTEERAGVPTDTAAAADEKPVSEPETGAAEGAGTESTSDGTQHHHHHHKHHSKAWHRRQRLRRKMKKNGKGCLIISLCLLGVISLVIVSTLVMYSSMAGAVGGDDEPYRPNDGILRIAVERPSSPARITHECVEEYMASPIKASAVSIMEDYGRKNVRSDYGYPVTIALAVNNLPNRVTVTRMSAIVSEHPDFSDPTVYQINLGEQLKLELKALKGNTTYYVKIVALLSNDTELVDQSTSFTTNDMPRILTIDRLYNVRDIGGWVIGEGDRDLKQGLLIRGSELDGFRRDEYYATPNGVTDLLTVLNIRTELDLRSPYQYLAGLDMLGGRVNHIHIEGPDHEQAFTDEGKEAVREIFAVLADESNYPVYIHDVESVGPTGTIVGLLEAYLGVPEGEILREYELSAFSTAAVSRYNMTKVLNQLKRSRGSTLREKAADYLLSCGVTDEQLAALDRIYLGD